MRFVVVGSGWRSLFYVRIAKAQPERYTLAALVTRSEEKAETLRREYQIQVVTSAEEAMALRPDFVVVSVSKPAIYDVSRFWLEKGFPVLCETPAAVDVEELKELWKLRKTTGCLLETAEQYLDYPSIAARLQLVEKGILGKISNMSLSRCHGYHGVSLIRRFLGTDMESVKIYGDRFRFPVTETGSRFGQIKNGAVREVTRDRLTFVFSSGKTAFFDFSGEQYHSLIRSYHICVQGDRGELYDSTVRYLDANGEPQSETIVTSMLSDDRVTKITMGENTLYSPEEDRALMPQDETAIRRALDGMERLIKTGEESYTLADSLQDAYLSLLMEEALTKQTAVVSEPMPWQ